MIFDSIANGWFRLVRAVDVQIPEADYHVHLPAGFLTNFGTIPWFARWLISPIDPQLRTAAAVHDFLVGEFGPQGYITHEDGACEYVDWRKAAAILRSIMDADGAKTWKRQTVYWAVRLYGIVA